jgi:hypothetical protein
MDLVSKSSLVLSGGLAVGDATLNATVASIAGVHVQGGTGVFVVKGPGLSRVDLNLSGGPSVEVRNDTARFPLGASSVDGGPLGSWALHNCWTGTGWFFPASVLASVSDPSVVVSYVGRETRQGLTVDHLHAYRNLQNGKPHFIALTRELSTIDIYLDSASMLPVAIEFNLHPDEDALTNIPVEIRYSAYQAVNGVMVPRHIEKFTSGALALDIVVSSATFNSGPPDSLFVVQ